MQFNFNSSDPIYLQVASQIKEAIFNGTFLEEEQIPSTTEISKKFHINPATVLKGMNILVDQDLIYKKRGLGMFIKQGAREKVIQQRSNQFFADYVIKLIKEAQNLKISQEDLLGLVKRGYLK